MESIGQALKEAIRQTNPSLLENIGEYDAEKYLHDKADTLNAVEGNLKGVNCCKCKNRGNIAIVKDGELRVRKCECMTARKSLWYIEQSGLKTLLDECTFDRYDATDPWQQHALSLSKDYVENGADKWLFFGGNPGSGKTHLCTAVCGELLKQNHAVKYMMWASESKKIKALINEAAEYEKLTKELKSVEVLYIDDFLKVKRGAQPTDADINLAFEIIVYRDVKNLRTIISSEKTIDDIISLDEALGSRINARSKAFQMNIALDKKKNYRLRK